MDDVVSQFDSDIDTTIKTFMPYHAIIYPMSPKEYQSHRRPCVNRM